MQLLIPGIPCRPVILRNGMSRTSFIVGLVLWTLVLGALYLIAVRKLSNDTDDDEFDSNAER